MLAKTLKQATAWREGNSSRDKRNITASAAGGRPATTRIPEFVETSQQQQQGRQQHNMDDNNS